MHVSGKQFVACCVKIIFCSVSQPYVQIEPPTVRVVEGPLFSEVVAYYQHFQQTVCIHNVPGTPTPPQ